MSRFDPGAEQASIVSVTDRVRAVSLGAPVTAVHFLGERAAFVGAEENVALVDAEGEISRVAVSGGGILCAVSDGKRVVTWCTLQGSTNDYYSFEYVDARPEAGRDGAYSVLKNYGIDY